MAHPRDRANPAPDEARGRAGAGRSRTYEGAGYGWGDYASEEELGSRRGYYGSGGSYGYGGAFEHSGQRGYESAYQGSGYVGGEQFYEYTGGFGSHEREGFSPGRRRETPRALEATRQRGPFYGRMPKGYTRSDERIREDVCEQLSQGLFDPSDIAVLVAGGTVTLEGSVDSRQTKFQVEELVESVLGVKEIENRLHVARAPSAAPRGLSSQPGTKAPNLDPNGPRS